MNNTYYVTGYSYSSNTGYDIETIALDDSLNVLWSNKWNGADSLDDKSNAIDIDANGDVYITGYTTSNTRGQDMILQKLDGNTGSILWQRIFNGPDDSHDSGTDIEINGSSVYVTGYTTSGGQVFSTGCYDTSGVLRWQKMSNTGVYSMEPDLALDVEGNPVIGVAVFGLLYIEKYTVFDIPTTAVVDTGGNPLYKANELIVSFNPTKINTSFIDSKDKLFAPIEEIIDSALVVEMESKLGVMLRKNKDVAIIKIFQKLTTADSISVSRSGRNVKMPPFWAILSFRMPVSVDEIDAMDSLNTISDIYYAELDGVFQMMGANDPIYNSGTSQSSLHYTTTYPDAHINVDSVWTDYEIGKDWVKLGVVDRGVLFTHRDFGNALDGSLSGSKIANGYNYDQPSYNPISTLHYGSSVNPTTYYYHGTQVAGIIGALRNNNTGVAGIAGGDPDSSNTGVGLYDLIVCCNAGASLNASYASRLAFAIEDGAYSGGTYGGLHIMNLSLAGQSNINNFTLRKQMLFARDNEVVMVTARGFINSSDIGSAGDSVQWYPACMNTDWTINVGGSGNDGRRLTNGNSTNPQNFYSPSGRGLDFIAPGAAENIYTTEGISNDPFTDNSYSSFMGTSAACAHVSGVVALMLADFQGRSSFPDNLNMEDIEHILAYTAYNHDSLGHYYSPKCGWGLINANEAMKVIQKPYYSVLHFTAWLDDSALSLEESDIADTLNGITIMDYGTSGSYNLASNIQVDQYKVSAVINHGDLISPNGQILGYWIRNSYSDFWSDYYSASGSRRMNGWSDIEFEYFTQDSAKLYGYVYNTPLVSNAWYPAHPSSTNLMRLSYTVHVYDSTGVTTVEPIDENMNLTIYPNPTYEILNLRLQIGQAENAIIQIIDMNGQVLYTMDNGLLPAGVNYITIPVNALAKGTYFLSLITDKNKKVEKFIKQ